MLRGKNQTNPKSRPPCKARAGRWQAGQIELLASRNPHPATRNPQHATRNTQRDISTSQLALNINPFYVSEAVRQTGRQMLINVLLDKTFGPIESRRLQLPKRLSLIHGPRHAQMNTAVYPSGQIFASFKSSVSASEFSGPKLALDPNYHVVVISFFIRCRPKYLQATAILNLYVLIKISRVFG